jgi:hypothetical protein
VSFLRPRLWPLLAALLLATSPACVDDKDRVPGAPSACDSREGPLLGCGPTPGGELDVDSIRAACRKLAACGLVTISPHNGARSFDQCVSDFEGYAADLLPAILACIDHAACQDLPDPKDRTSTICERYSS